MQILGSQTLVVSSLLTLLTGCAGIQTSAQAELPKADEVEAPQVVTDYIDDRVTVPAVVPVQEQIEEVREELSELQDLDTLRIPEDEMEVVVPEPERINLEDITAEEMLLEEVQPEEAPRMIRQLSMLAGFRNFSDNGVWDRVDAEASIGLEYAHEIKDGLGFEVGAVGSIGTEDGGVGTVDVTGAAAEFYGGARYFLRHKRWTPYVGGGIAAILAGVDNDQGGQVADDQDFSLGFYLHGGVQYNLNDVMFLGLDLRYLTGTDLDLDAVSGDADYTQLGFVLGFRL